MNDPSKLWTLKEVILSGKHFYIYKDIQYAVQNLLHSQKLFNDTITALFVTGTILQNKVTIFRSNASYLCHEEMHIFYSKMPSHSANFNC
jgi:hypothetical protein